MDRIKQSLNGLSARMPFKDVGKSDIMAGLTSAIASVPDGMASGVLAGVNPVYGLYTLMIGTPLVSLITSTQIMVFNTTSAMTLVAADGLGDRSGTDRVAALFAISLLAGAFQLILGLLGLGQLTKFVSNAVMRGFLTGIAVLIILGQLWDLTGYSGESGTKLHQTADLIAHLGEIDYWTTIIGVGTLILMIALGYTRLSNFNLLIGLAVAVIAVQILEKTGVQSVALVKSLGEIPRSLPSLHIPELRLLPAMLLTAVAVAIVGLLQSAGVAQQFPNTDGSDPDDSRDFVAQGIGNIACGLFQAMPGGGSLSSTALVSAAGAKSRWANVIQGPMVIVMVLIFSGLLSLVPMASLAALLIYSASLAIRLPAIQSVANTHSSSFVSMVVTFLAALIFPLQQAVMLGVILAAVLFVYRSSIDIRINRLVEENGEIIEMPAPTILPANEVTVLDIRGNLFYAGARTLSQQLPKVGPSEHAVVVLRMRGKTDLGSTFFGVIGAYARQVQASGGRLYLSGVDESVKASMTRTGHLDQIGADNVYVASAAISRSTMAAIAAGSEWLRQLESSAGLPPAATG